MDSQEIVISYRTAKDKEAQIPILADLTGTDIETIIEVLRDAGEVNGYRRICSVCGVEFPTLQKGGRAKCPSCREKAREERKRRENVRAHKRAQIKRNLAKIQDLQRENERLRTELEVEHGNYNG